MLYCYNPLRIVKFLHFRRVFIRLVHVLGVIQELSLLQDSEMCPRYGEYSIKQSVYQNKVFIYLFFTFVYYLGKNRNEVCKSVPAIPHLFLLKPLRDVESPGVEAPCDVEEASFGLACFFPLN